MPYTKDNIPDAIKGIPEHAQAIFIAAYNSAYDQYKGDEGKINAVAWAAVKTKYEQDKDGNWKAKESADYAYTPIDGDWNLRIRGKDGLDKALVEKAANALSPGGVNGKKIIPDADAPLVRMRLREAYRELGIAESKWVKEDTMREYVKESVTIAAEEATAENIAKGIVPVRIIRPGFNDSKGKYYTKQAVESGKTLFEGAKMFANHSTKTEEKERPERDIRDWSGTLQDVKMSEKGNLIGNAVIHAGWLKEMVSNLFEAGNLSKLGVSINTLGKGVRGKVEDCETFIVESLVKHPLGSVDFVTEAGAGGAVGLMESVDVKADVYLMDMKQLREARPDLVQTIEEEISNKFKTQEANKMATELETIKLLETAKATLEAENTSLKAKIGESEKATKIAEAKVLIDKAINDSALPEASKARLIESFAGKESAEGVAEAVKAEAAYVQSIKESGKVKGVGVTQIDTEVSRKALVESFKRLGMTDAQAETAVRGK